MCYTCLKFTFLILFKFVFNYPVLREVIIRNIIRIYKQLDTLKIFYS